MISKKINADEYSGVCVFAEIQDHEKVLDGALELLTKGRILADTLGEKLYAIVMGLDAEQYLPDVLAYCPDVIICCSDKRLKHYDSEIFPEIASRITEKIKPSIMLFPGTEAGGDLAPRLAWRFETGLTSHCTDLDIVHSEQYCRDLLLMKRPGFSGNMIASIICPYKRPQLATVQPGVFEKKEPAKKNETEIVMMESDPASIKTSIENMEAPIRWDRNHVPLEQAERIIAGGRGLQTSENFNRLYDLADLLSAEVGATRVPVFNSWCSEERMIGQTGKSVKPELYIARGISGQIQHTASIVDSGRIISVNNDPKAPINEISDYVIELNNFRRYG